MWLLVSTVYVPNVPTVPSSHALTQDCDGWVELPIIVEERHVVHLGKRLVGVGVTRRPLQPRPCPHSGVPTNNTVERDRS